MASGTRQPKWDIHEAVILLDGYLEAQQGAQPKSHIIKRISADLRIMAHNTDVVYITATFYVSYTQGGFGNNGIYPTPGNNELVKFALGTGWASYTNSTYIKAWHHQLTESNQLNAKYTFNKKISFRALGDTSAKTLSIAASILSEEGGTQSYRCVGFPGIGAFTGKIKCGVCGCSFMHNVRKNRAKSVSLYGEQYATWGCGTKKKKGSTCRMKEIPEVILKQVCADILGLDEFDDAVFTERVDWIAVPKDYTLVFHFKDGTEQTATWKSTAKSDVWDDAYKDRQREWVKNHMANSDSFSEFTTRFKCGICGSSMRRSSQPSKTTEGRKQGYWRCSCADCSNHKGYREDFLIAYTNEVLGLDKRDPEAFREQIDTLEAVSPLELVYHFKDGRKIHHEWPIKYPRPKWSQEQREHFNETQKRKKEAKLNGTESNGNSGNADPVYPGSADGTEKA